MNLSPLYRYILGLDLGTNSIGWALIALADNGQPINIIDCGVRIFQEAVEAKTRTPKNHARRAARSQRKLVSRRRMRRQLLCHILMDHEFLPADFDISNDAADFNALGDPYALRAQGLGQALSRPQLARIFLHMAKRRGFQSNRKTKGDDDGVVKAAIARLRGDIQAANCRTLGEYLHHQDKKRERYTDRAMYQHEFETLWAAQQEHHPNLLTAALKAKIHNALFFQRPLKSQKGLVGNCPFESKRRRAPKALLEAQRARIWQDLNHLEIKNPLTRQYRKLEQPDKEKLYAILEKQKTLSWGQVRKKLGLHEGEIFNLEEGKKTELTGNRTAVTLRDALGAAWDALSLSQQQALITDMLTIDHEGGFIRRMIEHWHFDADTAQKLAQTELEPGYARLSVKALNNILPHLQAGFRYDEACAEAGYNHAQPSPTRVAGQLMSPPELRNPVVQKALFEARRVVNALIRQYGKPQTIRIEMARDMKLNAKQKEAAQKQNKANEKLNKEAEAFAHSKGITHPSRNDKIKYRLWKECAMTCPYTGQAISQEMLYSDEVDIEHIIPYSLCLDDSYMNKTLCLAAENRQHKKNRTPFEAYAGDEKQYQEILARVKTLPWQKRRKFEQEEVKIDDFVARQLNDTRYICVAVKDYLLPLGVPVEVSKGMATADLRWHWGLDAILNDSGELAKNRADHRHHAIDAITIALTTRSLYLRLAHKYEAGFALNPPWPTFNKDVREKIDQIIVSHATTHHIAGALHEDTAYGAGFVWSQDKKGNRIKEPIYVYRKPLDEKFSAKQAANIRDEKIKALVLARLDACGGDSKKAFGNRDQPLMHVDGKTPIRSVRLITRMNPATVHPLKDREGKPYKYVAYGNNHHVEIIEHTATGKRKGIFVTAMEAARRVRIAKVDIVQRQGPWQNDGEEYGKGWRFVMDLCINDMVSIHLQDAQRLFRVQKFDASNGNIIFRAINSATLEDKETQYQKAAHLLTCNKLQVDPIGNILECRD